MPCTVASFCDSVSSSGGVPPPIHKKNKQEAVPTCSASARAGREIHTTHMHWGAVDLKCHPARHNCSLQGSRYNVSGQNKSRRQLPGSTFWLSGIRRQGTAEVTEAMKLLCIVLMVLALMMQVRAVTDEPVTDEPVTKYIFNLNRK